MASHLQPFSPPQVQNTESKFHVFPQLPKELRDRIWYNSIQHSQIFHLHLCDLDHIPPPTTDGAETNHPANSQHDQCFFAVTDGIKTAGKLFRVNHESREVALSFYWVRPPYWFRTRSVDEVVLDPGKLYFNTEQDFLRISFQWSAKNTLFPFLRLLKMNYDPLHVGLCNLIVGKIDFSSYDPWLAEPSTSDIGAGLKETFKNTLENLPQVLFYSTVNYTGRQIYGRIKADKIKYNRWIPIQASLPSFGRLPYDPRAIGEYIKAM